MKETTSTQLQQGYAFSRTMDYVIQSGPVKLKCTQRPDIVIVSANDYEEMKLKIEGLESDKILP